MSSDINENNNSIVAIISVLSEYLNVATLEKVVDQSIIKKKELDPNNIQNIQNIVVQANSIKDSPSYKVGGRKKKSK